MSVDAEMVARHSRVLAELSELGLELARDLQARALAAEDIDTASNLALAFHRISRSVRQTMALEAKLERDRNRQDAERQTEATREAEVLRKVRKARVHAAVERLIWTEAEDEDQEHLLEDLDLILNEAALSPAFLEASVETHIQRIRHALGLAAETDGDDFPPDDLRRSSA